MLISQNRNDRNGERVRQIFHSINTKLNVIIPTETLNKI